MHALQILLVAVFRETSSVTDKKKGAGRSTVRIEEIVTRNKLRRTFFMTTFDQDNVWYPGITHGKKVIKSLMLVDCKGNSSIELSA
jgi:hypothetical protein